MEWPETEGGEKAGGEEEDKEEKEVEKEDMVSGKSHHIKDTPAYSLYVETNNFIIQVIRHV